MRWEIDVWLVKYKIEQYVCSYYIFKFILATFYTSVAFFWLLFYYIVVLDVPPPNWNFAINYEMYQNI